MEVCLTVSRFNGGDVAITIAQETIRPESLPGDDGQEISYSGDMDGRLPASIEFSGVFGIVRQGIGRANFRLHYSGRQLLNVGGFFSRIPLAVEVYDEVTDCWLAVHATLDPDEASRSC